MGMIDQGKMLWKAKQVQGELKKTEVEAKSNNGWVTVVFNGELRLKEIHLSEEAMKAQKYELEKILQTTISEGLSRTQGVVAEKTRQVMKDLNLNIPGL